MTRWGGIYFSFSKFDLPLEEIKDIMLSGRKRYTEGRGVLFRGENSANYGSGDEHYGNLSSSARSTEQFYFDVNRTLIVHFGC